MESNMNEIKENTKWVHCPIYGGITRNKVYEDTVMFKFPLYYPKCKNETLIDVMQPKMAVNK